eukprot:4915-Prymnesium_polylepis.1
MQWQDWRSGGRDLRRAPRGDAPGARGCEGAFHGTSQFHKSHTRAGGGESGENEEGGDGAEPEA